MVTLLLLKAEYNSPSKARTVQFQTSPLVRLPEPTVAINEFTPLVTILLPPNVSTVPLYQYHSTVRVALSVSFAVTLQERFEVTLGELGVMRGVVMFGAVFGGGIMVRMFEITVVPSV